MGRGAGDECFRHLLHLMADGFSRDRGTDVGCRARLVVDHHRLRIVVRNCWGCDVIGIVVGRPAIAAAVPRTQPPAHRSPGQRRVPAAADVAEHLVQHLAAVETLGQHAMQRLALDLGDRVPQGGFNGADGDRAFGVTAGFFPLHHAGEDLGGIDVVAAGVEERFRRGFPDARDEAVAHLRAAGVAAGGVKGKANNRLAVTQHVCNDGDHRRSHLAEIKDRIAQARFQRDGGFTNIYDAHIKDSNSNHGGHSVYRGCIFAATLSVLSVSAAAKRVN